MPVGLEWEGGAWAAAAAAAVCAALAWHLARAPGSRRLKALRAAASLGLVLALLKPTLTLKSPVKVKPKLTVLIDDGHSMGSSAGSGTRLQQSLDFLRRNRRRIEDRAEPEFYSLSGQGRRLSGWDQALALSPSGQAFHPSDAFSDVAADPASAVSSRMWLLSDGSSEPDPQSLRALSRLKAPLDAFAVGPRRRGKSLAFADVKPPDFAFLHGSFSVSSALEASGLAGRTAHVRLLRERKSDPPNWDSVQEADARIGTDFDAWQATWTAIAQSLGTERYRLEASVSGGPSASRSFRVEIVRQKYRIMYLSGRPSPEYAFLREFLKADPNHELVSFVILRNPDNPTLVADNELSLIPFPAEQIFVQDLGQFDLFILENFSYARFHLPVGYLASLREFVSRGGALLVIGGENSFDLGGYRGTPLEELLPVTLASASSDFVSGPFQARPAAKGHPLVELLDTPQDSERAWAALPKLDGYARFGSVRPSATVLAVNPAENTESGQPLPIAAIRDFGRGKVMLLATDSTWRWRLGAAADWRAASFYGRFWSRVVQYLTGTLDLSKVKFAPLPDRLPPREPAVFSLRVFDESFRPVERSAAQLTVTWTPPGKPPREVPASESEPGVFTVELTGLSPGTHRLRALARYRGRAWGQDEVRFTWEESGQDEPVDRQWLKSAAQATGGSFNEADNADVAALLGRLPPVRVVSEVRTRTAPWQSSLWLWATAGLFLAEWALRRLRGLP